jgi:hypothetical protein
MHLPNYKNGSIVNLMSSVMRAYGEKSKYAPLKTLDIGALRKSTNIVLLVVDGLGYEYLQQYGANSILKEHLRDRMTSVFPSTTATGITTFLTGLAPQQHAVTGWFMLVKELGVVARILPFNPRYGGSPISKTGIDPNLVIGQQPLSARLKAESYYTIPQNLFESDYTTATSIGAKKISYDSLDECLDKIKNIVFSNSKRKFIYAYLSEFDSLCHEFGTQSQEALHYFRELDHAIVNLMDSLRKTNTTLLITSDHGLIDTETLDRISLEEHPGLAETLSLPLCGEPRVVYCYVHPSKVKQFREYVTANLDEYCTMHSSRDLIRKHFFGLYEPDPRLFDRIGDYILIMKDNYVLKDFVLSEPRHFLKANHGGVSSQEMYVPLITIIC